MNKNCIECGNQFRASKDRNKFCSRACYHLSLKEKDPRICLSCSKEFFVISKSSSQKYCSRSCSASRNNVLHPKRTTEYGLCLMCSKRLTHHGKYCSTTCNTMYNYRSYIEKWLAGVESGSTKYGATSPVRRWIEEKYGLLCWECGWNRPHPISGKPPLQLDHIDGDAMNNRPENLRLLCGGCHSLTITWGRWGGRSSTRSYRYNKS